MHRLVRTLLSAILPTAVLLTATPAHPAEVLPTRCKPTEPASATNPPCEWVRAVVTGVADGDTFDVKQADGTRYRMRNIGINAMELKTYSLTDAARRAGRDCTTAPDGYRGHAVAAANRAEQLVRRTGGNVYLAAQDLSRATGDGRMRRSIWTYQGGVWTDVSKVLVQEGLALWLANPEEWAHTEYGYWTQRAAVAGVGLYDRDKCGVGPQQDARLSIWVNADAEGADGANLNGEWARIRNTGATDVRLGGWWLRDALRSVAPGSVSAYVFPPGTVVRAGSAITLHVGTGTNTATRLFWNQSISIFNNIDRARGQGEGAYLFDPDGDLRSWTTYPCLHACSDPLQNKVDVRAQPTAPEHVSIKNISAATVDLQGHVLSESGKQYHLLQSTRLLPGATLRLYVRGSASRDTPTTKYWGQSGDILSATSDVVRLRSYTDVLVDCHRWGTTAPRC